MKGVISNDLVCFFKFHIYQIIQKMSNLSGVKNLSLIQKKTLTCCPQILSDRIKGKVIELMSFRDTNFKFTF